MRQPFNPSGRTESKLLLRWNRKTEWKSLAWLLAGSHSKELPKTPLSQPAAPSPGYSEHPALLNVAFAISSSKGSSIPIFL